MEFLDPRAERRHNILLFVGYGLIAIAIAIASLVLLYWSYGYSLTNEGEVQQNGLVFVSSQPAGAGVTLNGKPQTAKTDARLTLAAGSYDLRLKLAGYREWRYDFKVQGGDVQRLVYPKLFPTKLVTSSIRYFEATPQLVTQSPNQRWLLIKQAATPNAFTQYDLRRSAEPVASEFSIPTETITAGDGAQSWSVVEWASDDQYVLLDHGFTSEGTAGHEYVLCNRASPDRSLNLTTSLGLTADEDLTLFDKKFDKYYVYNKQTKILRAVTSNGKLLTDQREHVLAYKTHGDDKVLYVTDTAENGQPLNGTVNVVLHEGSRRQVLRQLPATSPGYLLNLAQYENDWYLAVGATDGKGVYLYRNPIEQATAATQLPRTWRFMRVSNPSNVSFSANSQLVLTENAQTCVVYDAENIEVKRFTLQRPLDAPQTELRWMDGHHLTYVSGGKTIVVDYDNQNAVELQATLPQFTPYFSGDFKYVFSLASAEGAAVRLTSTPLIVTK